jgi:hypothetical protein
MIMHLLAGQAFLTSLIAGALAHDNGMDMSMDQGMAMNSGNMLMYLHFTIGDNLWFLGWAPNTAGAMVGACIGLFMLAMAERWLVHVRGVMEEHWSMRSVLPLCPHTFCCSVAQLFPSCTWLYSAQIALSNKLNSTTSASLEGHTKSSSGDSADPRPGGLRHNLPPFILAYDIPRGIFEVVIATINFVLMLTVM